ISDASGETLAQLAEHLGYDAISERPGVEPSFWKPGFFRLFVTHLAKDRALATTLQERLETFGISAFVAHKDIAPTAEWQDEILLALNTTDALVALLTPGFHESSWTDQEVGFVMGRGLLTVAVTLGETPYGFIGRLQAFSGTGKSEQALATEIFEAFVKNKQTKRRMASAVLTLFEQSYSFQVAKRNVALLEQIDYWEPQFEERIRRAIADNGQVRDSFGVPNRAYSVIRKWAPTKDDDAVQIEEIPFE
ncbi:MAG TPA: toll/interleukin-1 receptor domain-containing protein, partial [Dehalococcoidia bacterium]|nr:toll/interleukin-1 receptor domain-containing protein [Dehalococcoidia bacterium]